MTGPGRDEAIAVEESRPDVRIVIYDRTESYTYALLPFVVAYGLAGLILCRLPAPERPARPAVRVAS